MLWQVIRTFPPLQLEMPLSLLNRLLLCDPDPSFSHLKKADFVFFAPPRNSQLNASKHQALQTRTASSLLSELLQLVELWDSAVELLTLLSLVAHCSHIHSQIELHVEASVLRQALTHSYGKVRGAAYRLLGNLDPFRSPISHTLQPDIFKSMTDSLQDSCMLVRRLACRAVARWLGYIAAKLKMGDSRGKGSEAAGSSKEKERNKVKWPYCETAGDLDVAEVDERMWIEEVRRTSAVLVPLLVDPDALTRHHCCAALGNLVYIDGALSVLLDNDMASILLEAACTETDKAVRQAAISTLCLYSRLDPIRQVMK